MIGFLRNNQIYILVMGSVVVSVTLVSLSLHLYTASGTQQLDLSRPGYKGVQSKVQRDPIKDSYSATGPMSIEEINKFKKLYDKEVKAVKKVEGFSGDPLDPVGLGIVLEDGALPGAL